MPVIAQSRRSKQMKNCRECGHQVSEQAIACPQCGAPYPARDKWDGWGYEYKSKTKIIGLPLIHIAFKYRPNRRPVIAKGVIAIGQFGVGIINISQFGIGVFSLSQFTLAGYALAQFAIAWSLVAQFGIYIEEGHGQLVYRLFDLLARLF
jgi:ribosomal protein L37E